MKRIQNSKKGSSAVFLSIILAALIAIVMTLIYSVRENCIAGRMDGIVSLAGDSVMSEFNYYVQKDYGLFLIRGTDRELTEKLRGYIDFSVKNMEDANIQYVKATGSAFPASDTSLIRKQIIEHVKFIEAEGIEERIFKEDSKADNDMENAVLRHGPTIVSLPSYSVPEKSLTQLARNIAENEKNIEKVFKKGTEKYSINRYILSCFNNRVYKIDENHFFKNEAEYILGGEKSDRKNEKRVEMALKAMRIPLNLAHIYSDSEKRAAVITAAELIAPGAGAAAAQLALATTWAYAEADNDVELLWQGYKVPVIKDRSTWAIDLDSAVEGIMGGTVLPDEERGYDYTKYLQILLFFCDESMKTARILDLIQINMRKCYEKEFVIEEHAAGLGIDVKVNDKLYRYEKKY